MASKSKTGSKEKTGFKTYTCAFPGCGKIVSKRKSTVVDKKRMCATHVKSLVINIDTTKMNTNARYKLFASSLQSVS